MADEDDDEKQEANKGGKKKLIIMILAVVLLGGAGVGGSLYFTGMLGGTGKDAHVEEKVDEAKKKVPIYFAFPQPFTVNFETEAGLRFLQVSMEIMSYDLKAIDAVQVHMPVIKNNIILLLSNQSYGDLVSIEGKMKLREMSLKEIQAILKKYESGAVVEEVYFTNFVMQ